MKLKILQMILSLKRFRAHPAHIFSLIAVSQLVLGERRCIAEHFATDLGWGGKWNHWVRSFGEYFIVKIDNHFTKDGCLSKFWIFNDRNSSFIHDKYGTEDYNLSSQTSEGVTWILSKTQPLEKDFCVYLRVAFFSLSYSSTKISSYSSCANPTLSKRRKE